jgi:hypothetical protein
MPWDTFIETDMQDLLSKRQSDLDDGYPFKDMLNRHPAISFIMAWLEINEDWVLSDDEVIDTLKPLTKFMIEPPPSMDECDIESSSVVMNAIKASSVMVLIDWIAQNPDHDIGAMFLSDESPVSDSFRYRLRHILTVFLKTELLTLFFTKEHMEWIKKHL